MRVLFLLAVCSPALASELVVESTGLAPARELRYDLRDGQRQKAHVRFDVTVDVVMGPTQVKGAAPTVDAWMDMRVKKAPEGYSLDFVYKKVKVTGGEGQLASDEVREAMMALKGTEGSVVINTLGEVLSSDLDMVDANGQPKKMPFNVKDLGVRLPSEAVGVGAAWTITSEVPTELGIVFNQVTQYHVDAINGDLVTISSVVTQHADPGPIDASGAGLSGVAENSMRLDYSAASGSGTFTLSLKSPFALDGHVNVDLDMAMSMDLMGVTQAMTQKVATRMAIMPK